MCDRRGKLRSRYIFIRHPHIRRWRGWRWRYYKPTMRPNGHLGTLQLFSGLKTGHFSQAVGPSSSTIMTIYTVCEPKPLRSRNLTKVLRPGCVRRDNWPTLTQIKYQLTIHIEGNVTLHVRSMLACRQAVHFCMFGWPAVHWLMPAAAIQMHTVSPFAIQLVTNCIICCRKLPLHLQLHIRSLLGN